MSGGRVEISGNFVVHKYKLAFNTYNVIKLPKDAKILKIALQNDTPHVWIATNPEGPDSAPVNRLIAVIGTGWETKVDGTWQYVDTIFPGPLVFHCFDGGPVE